MKNLKKVLLVAILFFVLFNIVIQENAFAANIMQNITTMAGNSADPNANGAINSVNNIAGAIVTITRVIAAGIAIIMITVLAMKYMTAAPSEKADVKKHAIPYVVGAIIMFSVTGILGIIQDFTKVFD